MSEKRHIVSLQNTNTDGENMFEMLISSLYLISMPTVWACFATYIAWYFAKAKRYSPLTTAEARQLWTIHRHDTDCNGRKWRQLKRGKQTVGFECECGYKHVQKRPMIAHAPAALNNSQMSAFDSLHTSHKSA
jgi:hypothetical protein